jgi:uridine kinase
MDSSNNSSFTLEGLISREHLTVHDTVTSAAAAFDLVLPKDEMGLIRRPLIVGIDGSVTAGKSFLATALQSYLTGENIDCVIVRGDWFMVSRERRKKEIEKAKKGDYAILDYDAVACDFTTLARIQERIHKFLKSGRARDRVLIPNAYNRATGKLDKTIQLDLNGDSVVVVEGTGVLNAEANRTFDLSIRVDVSTYKETVRRLNVREFEKTAMQHLEESFIKERYNFIDYPYDQFLRSRDSRYFDILIDTSEPTLLKLYKRPLG